ncbi:hypothetical protein ALC53_05225 [Atta colombica]|uniref:Uncharacterized protein n=1 Tax=Atta colombica TaxID=520822 RepID=A0A195BJ95_9HYME|nr:hypothetical protein ALC53_05225 [Atta colombica]
MTVIIMMKMNARKEKGTEVGRCGAEAPMRLKVEQIENKGPVCGRSGHFQTCSVKQDIYICNSAPNLRFPPLPKTIDAKSRNIKELAARLITFIRRTHAYARVEHVVTAAMGVREGRLEGKDFTQFHNYPRYRLTVPTYIFPMLLSLLLPKLEDPLWMQLDEGITFFSAIHIAESQQNHRRELDHTGFVDIKLRSFDWLTFLEEIDEEIFHGYDTQRAVSLFTEIIEYLQTDLAPIIEHILLNASLFAFYLRAILAKSKSIIDTIWISELSYTSDVQMNLVILVSDNDHDSSG